MSLHKPANRAEFAEFCLRNLGKPLIDINVSDFHVQDAIEVSLSYYHDYHYDGSIHTLLKHQITTQDITNGYITLPEDVTGIRDLLNIADALQPTGWLSPQYQIMFNEINGLSDLQMAPYYMVRQQLEMIKSIMTGRPAVRFNRHNNKLFIDMNWNKLGVDNWIIIECYVKTNPDVNTDVWSDRWLLGYATAQIQLRWGNILSKYDGVVMNGGAVMNGTTIKDDALTAIGALEDEMINKYSLPPMDMIG